MTLLQAMQADAKICNMRAGLNPVPNYKLVDGRSVGGVFETAAKTNQANVLSYITKNPGAISREVAEHFNRTAVDIGSILKALNRRGLVKRTIAPKTRAIGAGGIPYQYWAVE